MSNNKSVKGLKKSSGCWNNSSIMQCFSSKDQMRVDEILKLSDSFDDVQPRPDTVNIEEAESSLREGGGLNYEEARALLGKYEYQKGNIEQAVRVFEGIDITSVTPRIKLTLSRIRDRPKRRSRSDPAPPMSLHAVNLFFEAMLLKAKSLQSLERSKEAAQSCKVILDIVESSLPAGLPENFGADSKLQETLIRAVEFLPELWKLADCPHDAILSYRKALLHRWNLDAETSARIQKEFSVYLLYSGGEASPPSLRSQKDSSFVPKSNLEEASLLLLLLFRKQIRKEIEWDPSIVEHLSFALSVANQPQALAWVIEALPSGIIERKEMYHTLALCYHAHDDTFSALNLLKTLLHHSEDPNHIPGLLLASKICSENPGLAEEGVAYAQRALVFKEDRCHLTAGCMYTLLGVSLSEYAESAVSDSERVTRQSEALQALESTGNLTNLSDSLSVYHLSLQYALQRKLEPAVYYSKQLLKLEGGTNIRGWLLLARILSGQKCYADAETVTDAALDQTGKWDQGELLRTKAKLQFAQGYLKKAIETYMKLLAVLQVKKKSSGSPKIDNHVWKLELQTWHDLACIYINLSHWKDAEICLSKSKAISPNSASRWHIIGSFHEAKGLYKQALDAFNTALNIDPCYVPSLVSSALILKQLNCKHNSVIRSYLMNALKLDRTNHVAWYNLGLLCKEDNESSVADAAECFEAAVFLEETDPVEPFR
ncbi:protein NPGR2 isoform X1 [Spinacia oleracea]|uniref:Protein NPGR2-like isoform X1 n=1 Tax=Spinacia oleracea TaxID=3562 RepID=A0A9R0JU97_SPIOL|nr:protein NPGR2-like isoform X1 [Spinacia oleracea]XP_021847349.1 protein NPGR2-like isoform X1 [Spinacia oleracea]